MSNNTVKSTLELGSDLMDTRHKWLSRFYACFEALREHVADNDSAAYSQTVKEMGVVMSEALKGQFQLTCDTDMITLHYVGKLDDVPFVLRHHMSVLYVEDSRGNVTCEKHRFEVRGRYNVPPPIGQHQARKGK